MYSETVATLLNDLKTHYDGEINVVISGDASGYLRHEDSQEVIKPDGSIEIQVTDTTNVDYTLSHELMHMMLQFKNFPQLQYHLLTGQPQLDDQLYATSTTLYNTVAHVLVVAWQHEHGLITPEVVDQVTAAFEDAVPAETPDSEELFIFRVLSLTDHLVFMNGGDEAQQAQWQAAFPVAYPQAKALYQGIIEKAPDTPFAFRRAAVRLLADFDTMITRFGYQETNNPEFATIPPVLSERQLRLTLNQVFELKHSEYRDRDTKERAYVAVGKSDQQNAFVLPLTQAQTTPEAFQQLYQRSLQDILTAYHLDYAIR